MTLELDPLFLEYFHPPYSSLRFESHIAESRAIDHNPCIPGEEENASRSPTPTSPGAKLLPMSSQPPRHSSFASCNKYERNRKPALKRLASDRAVLLANVVDEGRLAEMEVARQCDTRGMMLMRGLGPLSKEVLREEMVSEVRRLAALVVCPLGLVDEWEGNGDSGDDGEGCEDEVEGEDSAMADLSVDVEQLTDGSGCGSSGLEDGLDRMDLDVVGSVETNNAGASIEASSPQCQQSCASITPPKRKRRDIEDIVEVVNAHRHKRMLPEAQRRRSSFAFTIPI